MRRNQGSFHLIVTLAALGACQIATSQTVITVNAAANRKAINPNIYGIAWPGTGQQSDLNSPLARWGGNTTSRYNWSLNADNKGSDYYFESIGNASSVAGEAADTFIQNAKNAGAQPMLTVPILPYVAKLGANRAKLASFSIAKYGAQTGNDWQWFPDAGNGIRTTAGNPFVTGNDPLDANVANSSTFQGNWLTALLNKWGSASGGGVKYYVMDNEPALWNSTHRDVHPLGQRYDELYNLYVDYAGMIRTKDPNAVIVGPEEWGWTGYLFSGYDSAWAAQNGWGGPFPDKSTHGNLDHMPWFLQAMKNYQNSTGKKLLDVFSLHFYPQGGEFSDDDSAAMRSRRNRSTRALWDPNYVDETWIGTQVQLIPRMKSWVSTYFPGLQTGVTEYNWGNESKLNGATAQADIYGIFGREGLDMACRWTTPATNTPTYLAMKMYRNYDGTKKTFGETSVSCSTASPDNLSAFAAERTSDGAMTVMVVNKQTSSATIRIDLSGFTPAGTASGYQVNSATQTSITSLGTSTLSGNSLNASVPAQSVTLYVIPKSTGSTIYYDFESNTQSWTFSGAPMTGVTRSSTQHANGSWSLRAQVNGAAGTASAYIANPPTPAGKTVTFKVWIPSGSQITSIQPYAQAGAGGGWAWYGTWKPIAQLTTNAWNTITVAVPSNAVTPLYQMGVQVTTGATWNGYIYIDAISW